MRRSREVSANEFPQGAQYDGGSAHRGLAWLTRRRDGPPWPPCAADVAHTCRLDCRVVDQLALELLKGVGEVVLEQVRDARQLEPIEAVGKLALDRVEAVEIGELALHLGPPIVDAVGD
jgi:hypothetical protein